MRQLFYAFATILVALSCSTLAYSQDTLATQPKKSTKAWYESINLRGYVQVRYNRLLETNPELKCEQCDRSWGDNGGFFIRRARLIFFGNIHPRVYFYIQPDFASNASTDNLHFGQLRDAYFDVSVDKKSEFRFRIGQSKVPFGFENMQSSQNRLPLDRADALNTSLPNERELGVFFYYAPENTRKLFASLVRDGLKGSGDYGMFAFGAYNGQGANRPEQNDDPYVVTRFSYPFQVGKKQIMELGIQAYTGKYTMLTTQLSDATKVLFSKTDRTYLDQRAAATFVLYPKPFGILAEYNIGTRPEYNKTNNTIENRELKGGFMTLSYQKKWKNGQILMPYIRGQYYQGGKKFETDARSYEVKELETGLEWQLNPNFELVAAYVRSERRFEDFKKEDNLQKGNLLRLQAQLNF